MFKKVLAFFVLALIFIPELAAASGAPDLNPVCWTSKECADERIKNAANSNITLSQTEAAEGFVAGESPCVGETEAQLKWGKCLAGGVAKTSIGIGGVTQFKHIGEYIKTVYNYLLGIASIVAVVMILIAGTQWIVSAGSSETISQAKKRISGALIGLVLAWSSYLILNTINPWLTNFRLPQTWMLKAVQLMPEFCRDMQGADIKLALVEDKTVTPPTKKQFSELKGSDFNISLSKNEQGVIVDKDKIKCNQSFAPSNSGGATCAGHYCVSGLCFLNSDTPDDLLDYHCIDASMAGKVYSNSALSDGSTLNCALPNSLTGNNWEPPYTNSDSELVIICKPTNSFAVYSVISSGGYNFDTKNDSNNIVNFSIKRITDINNLTKKCGNTGENGLLAPSSDVENTGFLGFGVMLYVNENCDVTDELHIIGKGGKDLGYIDRTTIDATKLGGVYQHVNFYSLPTASDLFSEKEMSDGAYLNIDVSNVENID